MPIFAKNKRIYLSKKPRFQGEKTFSYKGPYCTLTSDQAQLQAIQFTDEKNTTDHMLKAIALGINTACLVQDWFHVYSDGPAKLAARNNAADIFYEKCQTSSSVRAQNTNSDGEILAIHMLKEKMFKKQPRKEFLSDDSHAASSEQMPNPPITTNVRKY